MARHQALAVFSMAKDLRWMLIGCVITGACTTKPVPLTATPPALHVGGERTRSADRAEMVFVPGGAFMMGSDTAMAKYARQLCQKSGGRLAIATCQANAFLDEQPAHRVQLDAFWIDRTEITNAHYQGCVEAGACDPPRLDSSYSRASYFENVAYTDYPVVNLDWRMAAQYCAWADARLPTEAEWEYAARGPESRIFAWGNDFERTKLNYCDAICPLISDKAYEDGFPDTAPVGSFPSGASWIRALDMTGNVREWVADWFGPYPSAEVSNPQGPVSGELKVTRGGSWYDTPDDVRGANRGGESVEYFRDNLGFRCAADVE